MNTLMQQIARIINRRLRGLVATSRASIIVVPIEHCDRLLEEMSNLSSPMHNADCAPSYMKRWKDGAWEMKEEDQPVKRSLGPHVVPEQLAARPISHCWRNAIPL